MRERLRDVLMSVIPRSNRLDKMAGYGRVATKKDENKGLHSGTTIVAFHYPGGLIFGADRRMTGGPSFIYSQDVIKIYEIASHAAIGGAGSVSDIQFVREVIKDINSGFLGRFETPLSVEGQANYLANLLRDFGYYVLPWGLNVQLILGGDNLKGEFSLFEIGPDGSLGKGDFLAIGSGTDGAINVLRQNRKNITERKLDFLGSVDLAIRAIYFAGEGDQGTSPLEVAQPTVAVITKKGFKFVNPKIVARSVAGLLEREK